MSIDNYSFEIAASSPAPAGRPDGWTITEVSTAVEYAAFSVFGASPDEGYPYESCEIGWPDEDQTLISELTDSNSEIAVFDVGPGQQLVEDFENHWGTAQGAFEIVSIDYAEFDALEYEAFESGWGTIIFVFSSELSEAQFGSAEYESFESAWRDNESSYVSTGTPLSPTYAQFVAGASSDAFESFESTILDRFFSVNPTTEKILLTSHGFSDEDIVYFYAYDDESSLPEPLEEDTPYYVVNAATDDFEVEEQIGDGTIGITSAGIGTFKVQANYKKYWTEELEL